MEVTMLLCDSAQAVEGKLYILGGGWTHLFTPNAPANMSLAILIAVPWNEANRRHDIRASLSTEDGSPVEMEGKPMVAQVQFEVGRPPGLKPGTQINTPLAFNLQGLVLEAGGYVWELHINDNLEARRPFRVESPPMR
jgi:hypothetical protein